MKKILSVGSVIAIVVGAGFLIFNNAYASPSTVYVDASATSSGNGTAALPYQTIQAGVTAAQSGDTVDVASGTYAEAVSITKDLTIVGAGATSTVITAPGTLPAEGAIINVDGTGVSADISGLTVKGPGPTGCGSLMSGVFISGGAYASIHNMTLTNIADGPLSGCQNGRAVLVGWGHGVGSGLAITTASATVSNLTISGYQKAGIEVSGAGSSAIITNNVITGVGATSTIAQNGIEVTYGASGNISGNTVTGNSYVPAGDTAAGILLYEPAATTTVGTNSVNGNQFGLWTDDQASFPAVSVSGISGNTRNALADTSGWTTPPPSAVVDASFTGISDTDGGDIVPGGVIGYNAFTTIQPAITVLTSGGTVSVATGTYSGDVMIPTSGLTLRGTGSVILNLSSGYGINLDNPPYTPTGFTMSGFTVNASVGTTYAFKAYKADNLTLTNDTFNGGAGNTGGGVDINTTNNVIFNNVTAMGFNKNGFADTVAYTASDAPASGITFNGITATNNGWTGISFYTVGNAGGAASIGGVHFTGTNTISGNGEDIFIEGDTYANHIAHNTPAYTVTSDGTTLDLTHVAFGSSTLYDIENYQTAPVNAIGATFGGLTGNAMTPTQHTAESAKIYDKLDNSALGLVTYYVPDITPPTLVYNTPAANAVASATLPVSVTAGDAGSGIASVIVHVYNASGTYLDACGTGATNLGGVASDTYTCTLDVSSYPDGNYSLRSGTNDVAGNNQTVSLPFVVSHEAIVPSVPTLINPMNDAITPTNDFYFTWNPSTENSSNTITYEFHSSMNAAETGGVLTTGLWDSGTLTTSSIHSTGAPDGTWYWQVRAKDSAGNMSAWSDVWAVTLDTAAAPALATCPTGATASLVETDVVNASLSSPTAGTHTLANGQTYLLVASGTWQNGSRDAADASYVSADNWTTYLTGDDVPPYMLGDGSLSLQVQGSFVNWGAYQPTHEYAYLYAGTGSPVNFMVFDGDATVASATANASWYGDNSGNLDVSVYACNAPVSYVTTNPATGVITDDAMLNGTNVDDGASGHSFWVSTSTFSTASPNIPNGAYSTPDFGPINASTTFSASLSSLTTNAVLSGGAPGTMPAITPGTTYYYAAWSEVNGMWHPGTVLSFTTSPAPYVMTDAATGVTSAGATVNGKNGPVDADDTSFWVGTTSPAPFVSSTNPASELPSGWYGVDSLTQPVNGSFGYSYSNLTPGTEYYFVAWSEIGGIWYPGEVLHFTTPALGGDDTLSALGVSGGILTPDFDPGITSYTVLLPHNATTIPTVTATTTDASATDTVTQATSTTGTAIVAVVAQNGSSTQHYTVTFSLAPATTTLLHVVVLVDNSRGGVATSSDFTVNIVAGHPSITTFSGSALGTDVTMDPGTFLGVNVSLLPNYTAGSMGNCSGVSGVAGDSADCTIKETYNKTTYFSSGSSYAHGGGQVLGASITGDELLQQQIAALQAQLLALLQQYVTMLHSHTTH